MEIDEIIQEAISLHKMLVFQNMQIMKKPRKIKFYNAKKKALISELMDVMDFINQEGDEKKSESPAMKELNRISKLLNILENQVLDMVETNLNVLEYIK